MSDSLEVWRYSSAVATAVTFKNIEEYCLHSIRLEISILGWKALPGLSQFSSDNNDKIANFDSQI